MMTFRLTDTMVAQPGRLNRWLAVLGSVKVTLPALVLLALGVALAYERQGEGQATWPLVGPLSLLATNLLAAVAGNRAFRRQGALLVFHLALLAIIVLIAVGRLTYLRGAAEVVVGGEFEGLVMRDAGPWHNGRLADVRFANQGFAIHYAPGLQREETANQVAWRDADGLPRHATIGDQVPLVIHGYRFYTTHNKGFAPVFRWQPDHGRPLRGSVHLPAYPLHQYAQEQEWQLPDASRRVWIMLKFDEVLLDPAQHSEFHLPGRHQLVVRTGDMRAELTQGDSMAVPGGILVYEGLRTWMGYAVFYDWTMPWLLAACALAVIALAWHFREKYFARPWQEAS